MIKKFKFQYNDRSVKVTLNIKMVLIFSVLIFSLLLSLPFSNHIKHIFKLFPNLTEIEDQSLEVHFVDVGQGDAILIRFPNNETMIIDSGPPIARKSLRHYIDNVFLNKSDKNTFNYAMITHSDLDHIGNMKMVLDTYKIKTFYRPEILTKSEYEGIGAYDYNDSYKNIIDKITNLQSKNEMNVIFSKAGLTITDDKNADILTFLTPNRDNYGDYNSFSPVVVINANNNKVMLTGDADSISELEVINSSNLELLDVDVLKLGHHGSGNSTSLGFLETVKPEYAVISVGGDNPYSHPSEATINRIVEYSNSYQSSLKDNLYDTSKLGNIIFHANASGNLKTATIQNIFGYLFVEWYIIVLVAILIIFVSGVILSFKVKILKLHKP